MRRAVCAWAPRPHAAARGSDSLWPRRCGEEQPNGAKAVAAMRSRLTSTADCLVSAAGSPASDGGYALSRACVVRDANIGHQLAGDNSIWCPKLESRTTHRLFGGQVKHPLLEPGQRLLQRPLRAGGAGGCSVQNFGHARCIKRRIEGQAREGGRSYRQRRAGAEAARGGSHSVAGAAGLVGLLVGDDRPPGEHRLPGLDYLDRQRVPTGSAAILC